MIFTDLPVRLDIIKVYQTTDAQENCFKRSVKIYFKTASTCFGVINIIRSALFELAKVTVVKTVY